MQVRSKKLLISSFWLSLLLHLLLFSSLVINILLQPAVPPPKSATHYVPAYTYRGGIQPAAPTQSSTQKQLTKKINAREKASDQSFSPPQKTTEGEQYMRAKKSPVRESILASSLKMLEDNQREALRSQQTEDPIYLIGDMSQAADPLIKLIGKALSAHFHYPETAGRFGIKGRALIGFTLHPQGYLSDVQMLVSSQNHDLDSAALYAVNMAPTIVGVDRFIQKPKHFVIGFIFY
jgi:TonB family protein